MVRRGGGGGAQGARPRPAATGRDRDDGPSGAQPEPDAARRASSRARAAPRARTYATSSNPAALELVLSPVVRRAERHDEQPDERERREPDRGPARDERRVGPAVVPGESRDGEPEEHRRGEQRVEDGRADEVAVDEPRQRQQRRAPRAALTNRLPALAVPGEHRVLLVAGPVVDELERLARARGRRAAQRRAEREVVRRIGHRTGGRFGGAWRVVRSDRRRVRKRLARHARDRRRRRERRTDGVDPALLPPLVVAERRPWRRGRVRVELVAGDRLALLGCGDHRRRPVVGDDGRRPPTARQLLDLAPELARELVVPGGVPGGGGRRRQGPPLFAVRLVEPVQVVERTARRRRRGGEHVRVRRGPRRAVGRLDRRDASSVVVPRLAPERVFDLVGGVREDRHLGRVVVLGPVDGVREDRHLGRVVVLGPVDGVREGRHVGRVVVLGPVDGVRQDRHVGHLEVGVIVRGGGVRHLDGVLVELGVELARRASVLARRAPGALVGRAGRERQGVGVAYGGHRVGPLVVAGIAVARFRIGRHGLELEREFVPLVEAVPVRRRVGVALPGEQLLDAQVGVEVARLVVVVVRQGARARPDVRAAVLGVELLGRLPVQLFVDHRGGVFEGC